MTVKQRIRMLRLAEKLQKNKLYADKVGVSVEIKQNKKEKKEN